VGARRRCKLPCPEVKSAERELKWRSQVVGAGQLSLSKCVRQRERLGINVACHLNRFDLKVVLDWNEKKTP
jgi:hypothetical protein